MRCVVAALVVFGLGSVAAADPAHDWSLDLPAGWTPDQAVADKARHDAGDAPFLRDVFAWHAPNDMTSLLLLQAGVFDMSSRHDVGEFDRGVLKPVRDAGATVHETQPLHTVGTMMVAESTIEMPTGVHGRWVRRYIAAKDGTHLVVAMCFGQDAKPPCDATLDTMKFAVANPETFDTSSSSEMTPYQIGKIAGGALVIIAVIVLVVRRKKPA